jgi:hypothetical protein
MNLPALGGSGFLYAGSIFRPLNALKRNSKQNPQLQSAAGFFI